MAPSLSLWGLLTIFVLGSASAQDTGIAVERFAPAAGPSAFGQIESATVAPPAQLWLTGGLMAIGRPLVLRSALTGDEVAVPVRNRVTFDLGAELGLWRRRLSIGVGVPLSLWQAGDRLQKTGVQSGDAVGTSEPLQLLGLGDIRVRAKMRLSPVDSNFGAAAIFEITAPGGGQHDFIATKSVTVAPHLLGSFRFRWLVGAANLAVRFAAEREIYQSRLHHEFEWGAALGAVLPVRRVGLGLYTEAIGHLNLVAPTFEHGTELHGALRIGWWQGAIDFGGGAGFGPYTPGWRGFIILRTWFGESGISGCATKPVTF